MVLRNKRVLVTGGASGIGLEIARAMRQAGARIFVVARHADAVEAAVASLGGGEGAGGCAADVTREDGRSTMLAAAEAAMGGLDVLVNNAGAVRGGRLEAAGEDEIRAMLETNLAGPILLTRAALPALRRSGDALVVNVSSEIGRVGLPFYAVYAATKAGVAAFSDALRRELAGEGVRVITLYPTATDTPMMATTGRAEGARQNPADVAAALMVAISADEVEVVLVDEGRRRLAALNRTDPGAADAMIAPMKASLETDSRQHRAL